MSLTEHSIIMSPIQKKKLIAGGSIMVKPHQFADSPMSIQVMPRLSRKIEIAKRKQKGITISLLPNERLLEEEKDGGKINWKHLGRNIVSGLKTVGRVVIPMATGALGAMAGSEFSPAGSMVGEQLGQSLGNNIVNKYMGKGIKLYKFGDARHSGDARHFSAGDEEVREGEGLFKTLHKLGISKKKVITEAKKVGKMVSKEASKIAGKAIADYTGSPQAGKAFEKLAGATSSKLIESGSAKQALSAGTSTAVSLGKQAVLDYANQHLPSELSDVVENVIDAGDGVDKTGSGFRKRMKRGGGSPYVSAPYKKSMKSITGGTLLGGSSVRPMSDLQTLSPYANIHSPQMSPFVLTHNPYARGKKMGGSFVPAG